MASPSSLPPPAQLELPLQVRASLDVSVSRLKDGTICLRQKRTLELEGSTAQAARIIGLSERAVRYMIEEGKLKARRPGKRKYLVDLIHARELREASML